MPKVTVLMAVYNGQPYLREAMESILAQTYTDFEFLIINDGSTDDTRDIVLSYKDPRIRLLDNDHNQGLAPSLNRGLLAAQGEYIARQDADDVSEIQRLTRQVTYLEAHPDVILVGSWYTEIDDKGAVIGRKQLPCDTTQIRWCLSFYCPFVHSAVMFRRTAVLSGIRLYDEAFQYAQDYDLWCRIARKAQVANLDEYLTRFRISSRSMTATWGDITLQQPFGISMAYMQELCGVAGDTIPMNQARFGRMTSLLFGVDVDFLPAEVEGLIAFIRDLHRRFCRYYDIGPPQALALDRALRKHLASRLLAMASCSWNLGDTRASRAFLFAAFGLQWISPLTADRLLLKHLLGRRGVAVLKSLAQRLGKRGPNHVAR